MSLRLCIMCDRCGIEYDGSRVPAGYRNAGADRAHGHTLRHEAKSEAWAVAVRSWSRPRAQGTLDFCPACERAADKEG